MYLYVQTQDQEMLSIIINNILTQNHLKTKPTINAVSKQAAIEECKKMAADAFNENVNSGSDPLMIMIVEELRVALILI